MPGGSASHADSGSFPLLVLGALGVVYGDVGTSPLYAFREALHASGQVPDFMCATRPKPRPDRSTFRRSMLIAVVILVVNFRSSSALSAAYGIAVTG